MKTLNWLLHLSAIDNETPHQVNQLLPLFGCLVFVVRPGRYNRCSFSAALATGWITVDRQSRNRWPCGLRRLLMQNDIEEGLRGATSDCLHHRHRDPESADRDPRRRRPTGWRPATGSERRWDRRRTPTGAIQCSRTSPTWIVAETGRESLTVTWSQHALAWRTAQTRQTVEHHRALAIHECSFLHLVPVISRRTRQQDGRAYRGLTRHDIKPKYIRARAYIYIYIAYIWRHNRRFAIGDGRWVLEDRPPGPGSPPRPVTATTAAAVCRFTYSAGRPNGHYRAPWPGFSVQPAAAGAACRYSHNLLLRMQRPKSNGR